MHIEILDGFLISTSKIITIEKITTIKEERATAKGESTSSLLKLHSQITSSKNVTYRAQVWEINKKDVKKIALFAIVPEIITYDFLNHWRQKVLADYKNNAFYFPD